ncbi:dihydrofolate reductase family protein [Actinoplanes sp. NPDC051633]|uniref:dihydrofolate reductase family protein n=1 Tax=Actinoplanes sp. NPDC051633 TaxID=3155670 RepID=UPI0034362248
MRPIVNSTFVSLDGVINHMGNWHFDYVDAETDAFALEQLTAGDAMLMGRKTYDVYASAWPNRDGAYADRINAMPKYVVSSTLTDPAWQHTTVLSDDLVGQVRKLKAEPGGPILMHGYGPVAKTLLGAGLLDELHLWVHPVLAGVGAGEDLLLHEGLNVVLQPAGQRTFQNGVVLLSYRATND